MLVKLLNDEAAKTPKNKTSFTKNSKKEIDETHAKYRDSSYWDHMYTIFFEVSVAQTHAEAVKEWELVGYKFNPKGQNCFFHENKVNHLYILRNKLNGKEIEVGETCAASHSMPAGAKKYSQETYEKMRELCKEQKKLMIKAKSRKYMEKTGFYIEDALDLLIKNKPLIVSVIGESEFDKNIAILANLVKKYTGAKRSAAGERKNLVYWHDSDMKKLTELLNILFKKAPVLKKHRGFERKMRALYNFRKMFSQSEQLYIEQMHALWNKDLTAVDDEFPINKENADKLMALYQELITNSNLIELDLLQDGQFRLTLRLFENYYKNLLNKDDAALFNMIKDAFLFLTDKKSSEIENMRGKIEVIRPPRNTQEEPKYTLTAPIKKFIEQVNDEWPATGVISIKGKEKLEATLLDLRDKGSRLTQKQVLEKDGEFGNKIAFLKKYQPLFDRATKEQISDLYRTWSGNRFYIQSIAAVNSLYNNLRTKRYKYEHLFSRNIPDHEKLDDLQLFSKYLRAVARLNEKNPTAQLDTLLEKYRYHKKWDELLPKFNSLYVIDDALTLVNSEEFQNNLIFLQNNFILKSEITAPDLKKIDLLTTHSYPAASYNRLPFNDRQPAESCAILAQSISSLWHNLNILTSKQLEDIREAFYEDNDLTFNSLTLDELVNKTEGLELSRRLADLVKIYKTYGVLLKDWTIEIYRYLYDQSDQHLVILKKRIGIGEYIQRNNDNYLAEVKSYLESHDAQNEYFWAVSSFVNPFNGVLDSYNIEKIYNLIFLIEDKEQRRKAIDLAVRSFAEKLEYNKKRETVRTINYAISKFQSLNKE